MIQTLEAIFDGQVLHPAQPLDLKAGTRVKITVEPIASMNRGGDRSFL
ncbi:MAG: antitoxin family protein [Oculatellaceae cyanobacterium Prado106]|jgi:predicted DNA-binding antitoxin AbrB/MazE fold protein|nr:antitoxin family protein [Oculatellaceae cyanobacterium Prado106]